MLFSISYIQLPLTAMISVSLSLKRSEWQENRIETAEAEGDDARVGQDFC
jgi:hypothetical protein